MAGPDLHNGKPPRPNRLNGLCASQIKAAKAAKTRVNIPMSGIKKMSDICNVCVRNTIIVWR